MNVTLVCAHYLPKLGYLEVHLARAIAALGHRCTVVTTPAVPSYVKSLHGPLAPGPDLDGVVKIVRLKTRLTLGQIAIAGGLADAVARTNPDVVVVTGIGKYFPVPVYKLGLPTLTLIGDNKTSYTVGGFAQHLKVQLLIALFKRRAYLKALHHSRLVAYTPESFEAAALVLPARHRRDMLVQGHFISLGFDPASFYYDLELGKRKRSELGIEPHQIVIITATRLVPEKHLEDFVAHFAALPAHYHWLIVGADNSRYAQSFREMAAEQTTLGRIAILPYAARGDLNAFFNAADIAFYPTAAITVFEALGTGLPCVLPRDETLRHVVGREDMVQTFETRQGHEAAAAILRAGAQLRQGRLRGSFAHKTAQLYSWEGIASLLLGMVPKG
jgi:glycosyltransferase involved in cell wall biosynthesis